jgi:HEAT repeat protein
MFLALIVFSLGPNPSAPAQSASDAADAWHRLQTALQQEDSDGRTQVIAALATLGAENPQAVGLIIKALDDHSADVRQLAADKLGEMKATAAIPRLKTALKDSNPAVSFTAARALWNMGDKSGKDELLQVLARSRSAGPGLVQSTIHDTEKKLDKPQGVLMMGAEQATGFFFGPAGYGITIIKDVEKDRSLPARTVAITLIQDDKDPRSWEALRQATVDGSWIIRAAAARGLGNSRPGYIPVLKPLLNDSHRAPRYMAAASIIRLSGK